MADDEEKLDVEVEVEVEVELLEVQTIKLEEDGFDQEDFDDEFDEDFEEEADDGYEVLPTDANGD